uniref:Uncharacterized protein n=1 Tax=Tetranychus urticae TaxID=32264 RepID=T1KA91_TETUR
MDSQFDLAVRSLLSALEWLTVWDGKVSLGMFLKYWRLLSGTQFPGEDRGYQEVVTQLYRVRRSIVYDQFFIRITDWELPLGKPISLDFLRSIGGLKENS